VLTRPRNRSPYHAHLHPPLLTRDPSPAAAPPAGADRPGASGSAAGDDGDGAAAAAVPPLPLPLPPLPSRPGGLPPTLPGPLVPLSVGQMNEVAAGGKQARKDRLAAESRGWSGVFAR
jgi:hypothetical protein